MKSPKRLNVIFTEMEYKELKDKVRDSGTTISSLVREAVLDKPEPR